MTGNLILNEGHANHVTPHSLILAPGTANINRPHIAVTGNVFRGTPVMPKRADVDPSLEKWDVLNTIVP